jgi:hypothetical protein
MMAAEAAGSDQMVSCPFCERNFAESRLDAHIRACPDAPGRPERKTKAFHVKVLTDDNANEAKGLGKEPQRKKAPAKSAAAGPKWANQSNALRQAMAAARGDPAAQAAPAIDDRVECPCCGRKFEAAVAERHIPNCNNKPRRR